VDQRIAIGVAIGLGGLLALLGAVLLVPDTGGELPGAPPPIEAPRPPPRLQPAPSPAPARRVAPADDDDPGWNTAPPPRAYVPEVAQRPPVDPDRVYDVEDRGIASALFDRHPLLVACYTEHISTFGPVEGRPIVRATVLPEPNEDGERVEIHIENQGVALDALDACFAESMADANFGEVDIPTTVLQPIPLPRGG